MIFFKGNVGHSGEIVPSLRAARYNTAMRRLTIIFLFTTALFGAHFNHPDRFDALTLRLIKAGVEKERIQLLFNSPKARAIDEKAVAQIANISKIKAHRDAERKANEALMLKTALVKKHLQTYKKVYDQVEKEFGVNREIIAAILQKETALGAYTNYKHDAFTALVGMLDRLTLPEKPSARVKKRHKRLLKMAEDNLFALIVHYEKLGIDLSQAHVPSSYAGAVGIPQFMPMHFDMIAAPSAQDPLDLFHMPTAIYSTAKLLKKRFGWNKMVDFSAITKLETIKEQWYAFDDGKANFVYEKNLDGAKVPTFVKANADDPEIVLVGSIIKVLMRYNFSTPYALGILEIAKRSHG